jgi:signal transduction histidine kinase
MATHSFKSRRFQSLRWKLTLSYLGVTVAALLTVELLLLSGLGFGLVTLIKSGFLPEQIIQAATTSYTPILRFYLAQTPVDQQGLAFWLERVGFATGVNIPLTFDASDEVFVVASDGNLLAAKPADLLGIDQIGKRLDFQVIPGLEQPLQAALQGVNEIKQLYSLANPGDKVVMAVPVWDENQQRVLGVLVAMGEYPTVWTLLTDIAPILGISLLVFTIIAGLVGALYGSLAARGPVRRLDQIGEAIQAWSQGDFSVHVKDTVGDELSHLSERLNDMANQLQGFMETRQELALVGERNRLARELHDSAKQQAFAAAAQLNAARTLLQQDPQAAADHLEQAEGLIKDLRRELTTLVQQLRPSILQDQGLAEALRQFTEGWSRQNGIHLEVHLQGEQVLPLDIEKAVFRVMQEALANVARHSQASQAQLNLLVNSRQLSCSLHDDGLGFDSQNQPAGFGLRSMHERIQALAGTLTVVSQPGQGTTVTVTVPLQHSMYDRQEQPDG